MAPGKGTTGRACARWQEQVSLALRTSNAPVSIASRAVAQIPHISVL